MKRIANASLVLALSGSAVFAQQSTNIVGTGTEDVSLQNKTFVGPEGMPAATVSKLAEFTSTETGYAGGNGNTTNMDLDASGGAGLMLDHVDSSVVSNHSAVISGGNGGVAEAEEAGSGNGGRPEALGGSGIFVNQTHDAPDYTLGTDTIEINGGVVIRGGAGGSIVAKDFNITDASGGAALRVNDAHIVLNSASLIGGDGGAIDGTKASATVDGGFGLITDFDASLPFVGSDVEIRGGNGGSITSEEGGTRAYARGGTALNFWGLNAYIDPSVVMTVQGGTYQGGNGGVVFAQGGIDVSGGDGGYVNWQNTVIEGGTFKGGNAGSATVVDSTETPVENGGAGLYVFQNISLDVRGGTFEGGLGGPDGKHGAGLRLTATPSAKISGGDFKGLSLWVEARAGGNELEISGGNFEETLFASQSNIWENTIQVTGGNFTQPFRFSGVGTQEFYVVGLDTNIPPSGVGSENPLLTTGEVIQESGTVLVTGWEDRHFKTLQIHSGAMEFSNRSFALGDGASLKLFNPKTVVTYNDGFEAKAGSEILTSYNGINSSTLKVTGDSVFSLKKGVKWTIDGGSTSIGDGDLVMLVDATEGVLETNDFSAADVTYQGSDCSCLYKISDLFVQDDKYYARLAVAEIIVTNLVVAQREGTKLVDISYDLLSTETNAVMVSLVVSNGTFTVSTASVTGDVGMAVSPGMEKSMVWDSGADWNGNVALLTFGVLASPPPSPPTTIEEMVAIPAGTNSGTDPDFGSYSLTVDAFYMDKTEVSNDEMVRVMQWAYEHARLTVSSSSVKNTEGNVQELLDLDAPDCRITWNGTSFGIKPTKGAGYPCVEVTWYGAAAYCNYRSEMEGKGVCYNLSDWSCDFSKNGYRLPTSDEWEYAARGGLSGKRFPWGDTITHSQANYWSDDYYGYDISPTQGYHPDYDEGDTPYTSPVGSFAANGYGLVDMAGNVWEWCNTQSGSYRDRRGGSWNYSAYNLRCGREFLRDPDNSFGSIGFRAVSR